MGPSTDREGLDPFTTAAGRVPGSKITDPKALATSLMSGSAEPAGGRLPLSTTMMPLLLVLLLSCMPTDGCAEGSLRCQQPGFNASKRQVKKSSDWHVAKVCRR